MNYVAAFEAGVRHFDSSFGGVGGHPVNWKGTKCAKGGKTRRTKKPSQKFIIRFRRRSDTPESAEGPQVHGNTRLEVIWTIIPAVICVVLALLSRRSWAEIKQMMPKDAMQIEITGEQFAWNIRYAGPDGKLGTADDVVTLNQLHFPVGRPVVATLRSKDVIHSFFLPEFRVKQDAVPGMSTRIWFDAMRVGHWEIACAELCGLGHYRMKGFVTVESPEEYEKWLKEQAEHHHAEEEKHLFPKVLNLIDAAQREALGMEMLALQRHLDRVGEPRELVTQQTDSATPL